MSIRVIGLYLKILLPVSDCFVDPALCIKNVSAVEIGFRVIGLQRYRLFEVGHRFIGLSLSRESVSDIHLYKRGTQIIMRM